MVIWEDGIESESDLSSLSLPLSAFNSGSLNRTYLQILGHFVNINLAIFWMIYLFLKFFNNQNNFENTKIISFILIIFPRFQM